LVIGLRTFQIAVSDDQYLLFFSLVISDIGFLVNK
jgi:hypothetical protein